MTNGKIDYDYDYDKRARNNPQSAIRNPQFAKEA